MNKKYIFSGVSLMLFASVMAFSGAAFHLPILGESIGHTNDNPKIERTRAIGIASENVPTGAELKNAELVYNKNWAKNLWDLSYMVDHERIMVAIDADSGEIIRVFDSSKIPRYTEFNQDGKISLTSAVERVKTRLAVPDEYKPKIIKDVDDYHYLFIWQRFEDDVEIAPDNIVAEVNPYDGEIYSYRIIRHDVLPVLAPQKTSEEAKNTAESYLKTQGIDIVPKQVDIELKVDTDTNGVLKLAWFVKFVTDVPFEGHWTGLWIDAETGEIIKFDALK